MKVYGYLRASTQEQDAERAVNALNEFASKHKCEIERLYVENESGAKLDRPMLNELISNLKQGDIILVEQIDRLSRLKADEWKVLKNALEGKGAKIVSIDLPTSYKFLQSDDGDAITKAVLEAVNTMMLDILATMARKDYEDRKRRQKEGIAKAKAQGKYKGRPANPETVKKCKLAHELVNVNKMELQQAIELAGVGKATYYRWRRDK
ncbi:Resolvase/invertase-type recombinase catalytic domain-containing protein [Vibrio crassostreae]|nr:Resolvase/invertase-type recombinase catalytic domain-containing protein [Vibrio crassostreae]CAK2767260.1 Resolvase/invertase-type recombinase catalytic domain-containing protein [Vibrio crassostreae]CAK2769808.1 Resolvase/invertase-type recombinase catalytic domain-containing protein [Vibrio crassostreae]CAK2775375.1 Resolvase/invertase-type recombinase catalytic domain-containing protein [Vibrio crassostreae]CAK2777914.1 Resolvase/invertase-type recombinase catalytic domain-containing pro